MDKKSAIEIKNEQTAVEGANRSSQPTPNAPSFTIVCLAHRPYRETSGCPLLSRLIPRKLYFDTVIDIRIRAVFPDEHVAASPGKHIDTL